MLYVAHCDGGGLPAGALREGGSKSECDASEYRMGLVDAESGNMRLPSRAYC